VLPSVNRMRRADDFATVLRSGARARSGALVVHHTRTLTGADVPLVGLVVGKAVGGSVARHAVSRKLRAQLSARLDRLPSGSGTVVRALPGAAAADSAGLGGALDAALDRLVGAR
jgi:ribonuclease P protein component